MKTTTRQHINEAALGMTKLLTKITGMPDEEIDKIIDWDNAFHLKWSVKDMVEKANES
jgi:hypothetical protein